MAAGLELVVIAIPFVLAAVLVRWNGSAARTILFVREMVFGAIALVIALVLIGTGYGPAMVLGAITLFFFGLWLFVHKPYEEV